ncbi:MAG: hypothetical protein GF416_02755 [Candidatus Altiarchaeales archaeon]|nr:hypothetical protein [Candidatus Altiarchaeales archaeon]MBD3416039.1 hypothetical protein [Candidatus Altiarchaeales archaeon]
MAREKQRKPADETHTGEWKTLDGGQGVAGDGQIPVVGAKAAVHLQPGETMAAPGEIPPIQTRKPPVVRTPVQGAGVSEIGANTTLAPLEGHVPRISVVGRATGRLDEFSRSLGSVGSVRF